MTWICVGLRMWGVGVLLLSSVLAEEADLISPTDCGCLGDVKLTYHKVEQEFVLRAQFMPIANPATPYSVWLQEVIGGEAFFFVGDMTLAHTRGGRNDWRLELRTDGQAPPALGVSELSELSGRLIQVRELGSTNVVLWGALPLAVPPTKPTGEVWLGRLDLQRPIGMEKATGFVELNKTGTQQTFTVHAMKLDWGPGWPNWNRVFAIQIETGIASGEFKAVGNLKRQLKMNRLFEYKLTWELKLWSSTNAPSGLGVEDLSELDGRRVQVFDDLDRVWLETVLPSLAQKGTLRTTKWRVAMVPANDLPLRGQVKINFDPKHGRSRLDVKASGLTAASTCKVFIEDGIAAGMFTEYAPLNDKGQLSKDTKNGDLLPFGVPRIIDLTGRIVEVRDHDGVTVLRGQLP